MFLNSINIPDSIKEHFLEVNYKKNDNIIMQGDDNEYLFTLKSGTVEVSMITYQGQKLALRIHKPSDTFGILEIFNSELKTQNVIALTDCTVIKLHKDYVLQWMKEDFTFTLFIIDLLEQCFMQANSMAFSLASMTLRERILISIYQHYNAGTINKLTKAKLIQDTNAPRRSLNRSLKEFFDNNLLSYNAKKFTVLQPDLLEHYVNEIKKTKS